MNDDAIAEPKLAGPQFTDAAEESAKLVVPHHIRAASLNQNLSEPETMEGWTVEALRTVFDPEIPVNIYELGLIYHIEASHEAATVKVWMTLTSPMCPVAESMPGMVERAVRMSVPGAREVDVEIVWEPTWSPDMMTEAARLELGMM